MALTFRHYYVNLTYTEVALGGQSKQKDIYSRFMASKAPTPEAAAEEVADVQEVSDRGWTGFLRDYKDRPYLMDFVLRGAFKDSISMLQRCPESECKKPNLRSFRKIIDGLFFVFPRKILLRLPEGGVEGTLERPIRCLTAMGERIALAKSDTVPTGTSLKFELRTLGNGITEEQIVEVLDYFAYRGVSQWRNASWGTCEWSWCEKAEVELSNDCLLR